LRAWNNGRKKFACEFAGPTVVQGVVVILGKTGGSCVVGAPGAGEEKAAFGEAEIGPVNGG